MAGRSSRGSRRCVARRTATAPAAVGGDGAVALTSAAVAALPGLDGVRERFAGAAPEWLAFALVLELGSCLAFVVVFRGVFCPRLAWRPSYHLGMAAQGTNVLLPAGGASGLALGAWVLNRMGIPARQLGVRSVAFFVLTSAVNFATAALVGGALALGVLTGASAVGPDGRAGAARNRGDRDGRRRRTPARASW